MSVLPELPDHGPNRLAALDRRLSYAFLGLATILVAVVGFSSALTSLVQLGHERRRLSSVSAQLLAPGFETARSAGRFRMQRLADQLLERDPSIVYISVLDRTGVVAHAGLVTENLPGALVEAAAGAGGSVQVLEREVEGIHVTESTIELSAGYDRQWSGVLRYAVRSESLATVVLRDTLPVGFVALLLLGLALPVSRYLGRRFAAPVRQLAFDFAGIMRHTSLHLVVEDEQGRIAQASRVFRRSFGDHDQVLTQRVFADVRGLELGRTRETRVPIGGVEHVLHVARFPVEISPAGDVLRTGIVGTDVTEWRRAEEDRERLKTAIESIDVGVCIVEEGRGIIYANPCFVRMVDRETSALVGRPPFEVLAGEGAKLPGVKPGQLSPESGFRGRIIAQKSDGVGWQCDLVITPFYDRSARGETAIWAARDVDHEVQLEAQLRESQKSEAIGQLAGGIAHDFNNLLMVILSCATLLEEEQLSATAREDVKAITASAERATELTRQILAFARRQVLSIQEVDIREVVEHTIELMRRVVDRGIQFEVDVEPNAWLIQADRGQLQQALMNLVINARDALPSGGSITVRARNRRLAQGVGADGRDIEPGDYLVVSVEDTGTGIDASVVSKIFEPFFTTKAVGKGTGLGLSTVLGIVRQSAGQLWVESEVGRGTKFFLAFRRADSGPSGGPRATSATDEGSGELVMLVEDESSVRRIVHKLLEACNYRVEAFACGREAVAALDAGLKPDLVLSDLAMPEMNGAEVIRLVTERMPGLPAVLMSGYAAQVAQFGDAGDVELLDKPIEREALACALQRALRGRGG